MPNYANEPDLLLRDALYNFGTFYNVLINFKVFVLTVRRRVIREPLHGMFMLQNIHRLNKFCNYILGERHA